MRAEALKAEIAKLKGTWWVAVGGVAWSVMWTVDLVGREEWQIFFNIMRRPHEGGRLCITAEAETPEIVKKQIAEMRWKFDWWKTEKIDEFGWLPEPPFMVGTY